MFASWKMATSASGHLKEAARWIRRDFEADTEAFVYSIFPPGLYKIKVWLRLRENQFIEI